MLGVPVRRNDARCAEREWERLSDLGSTSDGTRLLVAMARTTDSSSTPRPLDIPKMEAGSGRGGRKDITFCLSPLSSLVSKTLQSTGNSGFCFAEMKEEHLNEWCKEA